jgi:hypothetical protein
MTLRRVQEAINDILKEHPEWGELPCIYSEDDEGNNYHKVINLPTPAKVEDINEYYLGVEGYWDGAEEGDGDINEKDVNCIVIN